MDPPRDGVENMAIDEALLESAAEIGIPTLRFYRWSPPTLSLGYFQRYDDRQSHAPSHRCAVVRRSTGGGAILHDRELTYSVVWPEQLKPSGASNVSHTWLYEAVHQALQSTLADFGVATQLVTAPTKRSTTQPFLCFQRRGHSDVLVGSDKVAGSAQRRRHGAILQHGSLLLSRSVSAPELPGIEELTGCRLAAEEFAEHWSGVFADQQSLILEASPLMGCKDISFGEVARKKYGRREWTRRR